MIILVRDVELGHPMPIEEIGDGTATSWCTRV